VPYSEQAQVLRGFRDTVLSKTPEGQELIKIYYYWSPAIVDIMADEKIKAGFKTILDAMMPFIRLEVNKQTLARRVG